ncbi:ATP-binding protein [Planctomycetota bacterium]
MEYIKRAIEAVISRALARDKSVLLLGPRQTGKTTMICQQPHALHINFMQPETRQRYEKNPSLLTGELEALADVSSHSMPMVILDEIQKVPDILDVVQDLIDRKIAKFILTGSSARKLRRHKQTNLLPGRVVALRLDSFSLNEWSPHSIESVLLDGSLPGVVPVTDATDREVDLASYVTTYLEQEVRAEALVRNLAPFARFLEYAAMDSGRLINANKLSNEIGVSHTTIRSYFQILEDCLIIEKIEPLTHTQTRKKLIRTQKYLFFDLGVRRLAAHEGRQLPNETMGHLFEQYVGLELLRLSRIADPTMRIRFWRDPDGPEVDWVIERNHRYTPIEVKWTQNPSPSDARHLHVFLKEYEPAEKGFVVCRTPRPVKLSQEVTAVSWQDLPTIIDSQETGKS